MPIQLGTSRYLRKGYLGSGEQVQLEMHSSRWYFFVGPDLLLMLCIAGWIAIATAAFPSFPQIPWLSAWLGRSIIPGASPASGPALIVLGFFIAALVLSLQLWAHPPTRKSSGSTAKELRAHPPARRSPGTTAKDKPHRGPLARAGLLAVMVLSLAGIGVTASASFTSLSLVPLAPYLGSAPRVGIAGVPAPADLFLGVFFALTLVGVFWYIRRWLAWSEDSYVVTDDRLIKQHRQFTGIGWRYDAQDVPIRHVRNLDVYQRHRGWKWLRCGTLEIHSLSEIPETHTVQDRDGLRTDPRLNPEFPYTNPRGDEIDEFPGVEWWFCVPNPLRVERTIHEMNVAIERSTRAAS